MSAVDYYLFLDGIPGDATTDKHAHEIDAVGFTFRESLATSTGGPPGVGKVIFDHLVVSAPTSSATPVLLVACASGRHLIRARLTCSSSGHPARELFVAELEDVTVAGLSVGASPNPAHGEESPLDEIALGFRKIRFTYTPQTNSGGSGTPVSAGWDLPGNHPL